VIDAASQQKESSIFTTSDQKVGLIHDKKKKVGQKASKKTSIISKMIEVDTNTLE